MHLVFPEKILLSEEGPNNIYRFFLPKTYDSFPTLDMREHLLSYAKTEHLDTHHPERYGEVYPESLEDAYFEELRNTKLPLYLENISSKFILEHTRHTYQEAGYFSEQCNAFLPEKTTQISIGCAITTLLYSTKEQYILEDALFSIVPPPRSPSHQKAFIAGVNSGLISRIRIEPGEEHFLSILIKTEKISILRLAECLLGGYEKIGDISDFRTVDIYL